MSHIHLELGAREASQPMSHAPARPRTALAIEAWAEAYATGRRAGEAHGRVVGRNLLAAEFRTLLQA